MKIYVAPAVKGLNTYFFLFNRLIKLIKNAYSSAERFKG